MFINKSIIIQSKQRVWLVYSPKIIGKDLLRDIQKNIKMLVAKSISVEKIESKDEIKDLPYR